MHSLKTPPPSCSLSTEAYFDTYNAAADAARVLHSTLASVASWSFQIFHRPLRLWTLRCQQFWTRGKCATQAEAWRSKSSNVRNIEKPWDDFAIPRRNLLPSTNLCCHLIWVHCLSGWFPSVVALWGQFSMLWWSQGHWGCQQLPGPGVLHLALQIHRSISKEITSIYCNYYDFYILYIYIYYIFLSFAIWAPVHQEYLERPFGSTASGDFEPLVAGP